MEITRPFSKRWLHLDYGILAVIIVAAVFLRFSGLHCKSYWTDEIRTLMRVDFDSSYSMQKNLGLSGEKQLAYYHLIFAYTSVFGRNLHSIRNLSAVSGVLAVLFMFILGRELIGVGGGLTAAALTTVMEPLLDCSQEARVYSLLVLTTILSIYFFIKLFRSQPSSNSFYRSSLLYLVFSLATMYLHYFGILVIIFQLAVGSFLVWKRKTRWKAHTVIPALLMIGFTPLMPTFITHSTSSPIELKTDWIPTIVTVKHVLKLTKFLLSGQTGIIVFSGLAIFCFIKLLRNLPEVLEWLGLVNISDKIKNLNDLGILFMKVPQTQTKKFWGVGWPEVFLFILAIGPIIAAYGITYWMIPVWVRRYMIVCLPAMILLISQMFVWVIGRKRLVAWLALAILVLGILDLIYIKKYYFYQKKPQLSHCLDWVARETSPDAPVHCNLEKWLVSVSAWYLEHVQGLKRSVYFKSKDSSGWKCLAGQPMNYQEKLYIICPKSKCKKKWHSLIRTLDEEYELEMTKHFVGYHVHVVRKIQK